MSLLLIVLLPYIGALVLASLPNGARNLTALTAGAFGIAAAAVLATEAPRVLAGEVPRFAVPWMPSLGIDLTLRLDGLALMFAGLIVGIGVLIILYARYYLHEHEPYARFFALLLAFMGSMLGIALAGNLIVILVFWEATSLCSFLLIGHWKHRADARQGARMALTITGFGALAMLGGMLLLGHMAGSYDLDQVLAAREAVQNHPLYVPALVLILLGAFTKSAQFPFHVWLPQAMAAPTPVSAYLHSAAMVKAGVFLLARLHPVLSGSDPWFYMVSTAGMITLLLGAWLALFQHDLKGLLAYSTLSHLGLITLLLGLSAPLATVAALFHMLNHAAFKASLFMAAGIIDHETGSRDMRKLNGLWQYMPQTATLAIIAAGAMAGVPLLNGFLSKEMFFAETLTVERLPLLRVATPLAAVLAGVFSVAYSVRFIHDVFFNGQPVGLARTPHDPPRWMKVPVAVLVVICLAVGIVPSHTVAPLLDAAAGAALGGTVPPYSLAIWHGFNLPLIMSTVALVGGLALYFGMLKVVHLHGLNFRPWGSIAYAAKMRALAAFSRGFSKRVYAARLQRHVLFLVLAALAAGALHGWHVAGDTVLQPATTPDIPAVLVWLIGVVAAIATVVIYRRRVIALVPLGAVGLVVSLVFVHYSAPDLALTQLLIEMISILVMLAALGHLPQHAPAEPSTLRRLRDLTLAAAAGIGMTLLTHALLVRPPDTIAGFYLDQSVPGGGGSNVVNVILVDFRGFDTLGEITVLALAALIVYALLRTQSLRRVREHPVAADRSPLIFAIGAGLVLPFALLMSAHLFMRGHNLPGGGFVGGLVLALALLLLQIARGPAPVRDGARIPVVCIALGLLVAAATGAVAIVLGYPFLTSAHAHPVLPVLGELPLASAMLFDLGVYLVVAGACMLAVLSLGRSRSATA